jgi:hypothetical protein
MQYGLCFALLLAYFLWQVTPVMVNSYEVWFVLGIAPSFSFEQESK